MWSCRVQQGQIPAPWRDHAKGEEKQRLETIERRLALKSATIEELLAKRRRIMTRCIRRMRRAEGKE